MDVSDNLGIVADWLNDQHYNLTHGLKSMEDAIKLWRYWQNNNLCGYCDMFQEWESEVMSENPEAKPLEWHIMQAIGYNPFDED